MNVDQSEPGNPDSIRTANARSYFSKHAYHDRNWLSLRRAEMIGALLDDISGASILDLGCGGGLVSIPLLERNEHLTLVDYSRGALDVASANIPEAQRDKATTIQSDLLSFTGTEPFDVVLCLGVLAHVDSTGETFQVVARNLRPGGRCIVQLSDSRNPLNWLWHALSPLRRLKLRATALPDILDTAARLGLRLVRKQNHLLLVPGLAQLLGSRVADYDRWVCRHALSALGTQTLLMFEKPAEPKESVSRPAAPAYARRSTRDTRRRARH